MSEVYRPSFVFETINTENIEDNFYLNAIASSIPFCINQEFLESTHEHIQKWLSDLALKQIPLNQIIRLNPAPLQEDSHTYTVQVAAPCEWEGKYMGQHQSLALAYIAYELMGANDPQRKYIEVNSEEMRIVEAMIDSINPAYIGIKSDLYGRLLELYTKVDFIKALQLYEKIPRQIIANRNESQIGERMNQFKEILARQQIEFAISNPTLPGIMTRYEDQKYQKVLANFILSILLTNSDITTVPPEAQRAYKQIVNPEVLADVLISNAKDWIERLLEEDLSTPVKDAINIINGNNNDPQIELFEQYRYFVENAIFLALDEKDIPNFKRRILQELRRFRMSSRNKKEPVVVLHALYLSYVPLDDIESLKEEIDTKILLENLENSERD